MGSKSDRKRAAIKFTWYALQLKQLSTLCKGGISDHVLWENDGDTWSSDPRLNEAELIHNQTAACAVLYCCHLLSSFPHQLNTRFKFTFSFLKPSFVCSFPFVCTESLWGFLATEDKEMEDRSLRETAGTVVIPQLLEQDHSNLSRSPALVKWMLPCAS